jgi:Tfp pilus assembly protein PilF
LNVHVWPTTLVIDKAGHEVAHVAGMPASFAADLGSYLDFAAAKINASELKRRLANRDIATDDPRQAAARHLQVARRLTESGQLDQARDQLEKALKLQPNDGALSVALARVLIVQGHPKESIEILDHLPADAAPPWQLSVLRGRVLIALERWDDARSAMGDALNLNPEPAEAYYVMGLIYQHDGEWSHAAESFRKAYESAVRMRPPSPATKS